MSGNPTTYFYEKQYNEIITRIGKIRDTILMESADDDEKAMMIADPLWVLDIIEQRLTRRKHEQH